MISSEESDRSHMKNPTKKNIDQTDESIKQAEKFLLDSYLIKLKNSFDLALEYRKDTNFYAQSAIRMSILFNGGALFLMMNLFVSLIIRKYYIDEHVYIQIITSISIFIAGAAFSIVASTCSYFGNLSGTREKAINANILIQDFLAEISINFQNTSSSRALLDKTAMEESRKKYEKSATANRTLVIWTMTISYIIFVFGVIYSLFWISRDIRFQEEDIFRYFLRKFY
jgi:hypothetical protein